MANAAEVSKTRDRIVDLAQYRHLATTAEERALDAADDGTVYSAEGGLGTFSVSIDLLAASVDTVMFVAKDPCRIVGFSEIHSVAGGSGAAVRPRKILAATVAAPGAAAAAGVIELTASIDLTTTVNTLVSPAITATAAQTLFAAGDKLALDFSGTLTALVGRLTAHFESL